MKAWLIDIRDALLLRSTAFARLQERPDAFFRGFIVIVVVALLVGLPAFVIDVVQGFGPAAVVEPTELQPGLHFDRAALAPMLRAAGLTDAMIEEALQRAEESALMAGTIATGIQKLPTALPRPVAQAAQALGRWLSQPFTSAGLPLTSAVLATWLGYGIWVMLVARLLGGRATLHGFFGATAYFAAPHLLAVFDRVPVAGPILSVVGAIWGLAIYVVATAVSQRLTLSRALLAVVLPLVVLFVVLSFTILPIGLIALLSGGSR